MTLEKEELMTTKASNSNEMNYYADLMSLRVWLRIGKEIESNGRTCRGVCKQAGVDHSLVLRQVRAAKNGQVPADTKLEIIDQLCRALDKPLSFFLGD